MDASGDHIEEREAMFANGHWICGAPARFGGSSATRKYTRSPLPVMWRCNRRVAAPGLHCWQHKPISDATDEVSGSD